jgi:site-specific DNA-methyltransferase (adenine-specific)
MEQNRMKIEDMALADLKPYERNAKKHDERQVENVMESIKQFGFSQPLVIDKNNVLIIGHCRLIAAKRLGLRAVPVVRMEDLSEEQAQKLRLLDNKLNESEWDMELLAEDIPELDFDGYDIDWGIEDLESIEGDTVETEIPPEPEKPTAQVGDLYQLGGTG